MSKAVVNADLSKEGKSMQRIPIIGLVLFLFSFLVAGREVHAQALLGDPSFVTGEMGKLQMSIGGGAVTSQKLKFDRGRFPIQTSSGTYVIEEKEETATFKNEQIFLTATVGMGKNFDIFGKLGQISMKDQGFEGSSGLAWGGGLRISPPQSGIFKLGLVIQAIYGQSEDDNVDVFITNFSGTSADGTGSEKLTMVRYDAFLGFSRSLKKSCLV